MLRVLFGLLLLTVSGCCGHPYAVNYGPPQTSTAYSPCPPGTVAISQVGPNGVTTYKCEKQTAFRVVQRPGNRIEERLIALEKSMKGVKSELGTSKKDLGALKKSSVLMNSKLDGILKSLEKLLTGGN